MSFDESIKEHLSLFIQYVNQAKAALRLMLNANSIISQPMIIFNSNVYEAFK